MTEILAAAGDAIGLLGDAATTLTGEPLFLFLIGVSIAPVGFKLFRMAKRSAR